VQKYPHRDISMFDQISGLHFLSAFFTPLVSSFRIPIEKQIIIKNNSRQFICFPGPSTDNIHNCIIMNPKKSEKNFPIRANFSVILIPHRTPNTMQRVGFSGHRKRALLVSITSGNLRDEKGTRLSCLSSWGIN
jgi:hypothetical protein